MANSGSHGFRRSLTSSSVLTWPNTWGVLRRKGDFIQDVIRRLTVIGSTSMLTSRGCLSNEGSISGLVEELQQQNLWEYLLPPDSEEEFCHVYGLQLKMASQGDNIARTVALAGYWLHKCLTDHPECRSHHLFNNVLPVLPSRVVDLVDYHPPPFSTSSRVKVVETHGLRGAYLALSYRWPMTQDSMLKLSPSNYNQLLHDIQANSLLKEVQDACTLAKGLGIRYLWVDSLCIMQGHSGDWHIEAKKMASVYINAVITIAAVDKTTLDTATKERPFLTNLKGLDAELDPESVYLELAQSGNFVSRPIGELDERGWAFQEKLLSARIISITREGIFWDCLNHTASNRRPLGILGDFSPKFEDADNRMLKRLLLVPNPKTPRKEYYWLWRRSIQNYTKRKLTFESDRLMALEGITHLMTSVFESDCVLGIWSKDALRSLVWFVESSDSDIILGTIQDSPISWIFTGYGRTLAPSWSWISVSKPVQYRLWHPYGQHIDIKSENVVERATVLDIATVCVESFGDRYFLGRLRIKGVVTIGYLLRSDIYLLQSDIYLPQRAKVARRVEELDEEWIEPYLRSTDPTIYHEKVLLDPARPPEFRSQSLPSPTKVYCLFLIEGGYTEALNGQYCLVLLSAENDTYERIGLCVANKRQICLGAKDHCVGDHEDYSDCMGEVSEIEII